MNASRPSASETPSDPATRRAGAALRLRSVGRGDRYHVAGQRKHRAEPGDPCAGDVTSAHRDAGASACRRSRLDQLREPMINDLEWHLRLVVKAATHVDYDPAIAALMIDHAMGPATPIRRSVRRFAVPALASGAVVVVTGGAVVASTIMQSDHGVSPGGPGGESTSPTVTTTCQLAPVVPTTVMATPGASSAPPSTDAAGRGADSVPVAGCSSAPEDAPGTRPPTPSRVVDSPRG